MVFDGFIAVMVLFDGFYCSLVCFLGLTMCIIGLYDYICNCYYYDIWYVFTGKEDPTMLGMLGTECLRRTKVVTVTTTSTMSV